MSIICILLRLLGFFEIKLNYKDYGGVRNRDYREIKNGDTVKPVLKGHLWDK